MKILWIPHASWHNPQRAHLFCRALSERHEVHVTDWVADFTSIRDYISRRYLRNFTYRRYKDGQITVHGIPRISPALYLRSLRQFNSLVYSHYLRRIIEKFSIDVVVGTFVAPPPNAPRLIFDLFDDNVSYWRSFGRSRAYADEIEQTELSYLQKADAVVAASSVLVDKAQPLVTRGSVYLIPNGVDLTRFKNADGLKFRANLGLTGVLVGAVGNQDKVSELYKIIDTAKIMDGSGITFLIAGRGSAIRDAKKRVYNECVTNIMFYGYVPPEELPEIIAALDVGLCPYQKTPGGDAGSPMRLLAYSAAGLPVVCTELEEVRRMGFPNVVLVEDKPVALVNGIKYAMRLPRGQPPQIKDYDIYYLSSRYEAVLRGENNVIHCIT